MNLLSRITTVSKTAFLIWLAVESTFRLDVVAEPSPSPTPPRVIYRPPVLGAPDAIVGGGTRGEKNQDLTLQVLAPNHTGLTSTPRPILYWFVSGIPKGRMELSIIDDNAEKPLLEATLDVPKDGYMFIDLAAHGKNLNPNIPYKWNVAVVNDEKQRSMDFLSGGEVMFRPRTAGSQKSAFSAKVSFEDAVTAAAEGYWYDAIHVLQSLVKNDQDRSRAEEARADMFEQAGLAFLNSRNISGNNN